MALLRLRESDSHKMNNRPETITEEQRYLIYDHPVYSFDAVKNWRLQFLLWKSMRRKPDAVIGLILLFLSPLLGWLLEAFIRWTTRAAIHGISKSSNIFDFDFDFDIAYASFTLLMFGGLLNGYIYIFVRRRLQREYKDVTVVGETADPNENSSENILHDPEFPSNKATDE